MSTTPGVVTAVRWTELFPWLILVRAARVALFIRVIVLAAAGVLLTQAGWSAIEGAMLPSEGVAPLARLTEPVTPLMPPQFLGYEAIDKYEWAGPLVRGWAWAIQPLTRLAHAEGLGAGAAFLLAGVWVMVVWALVGGAIARIAAIYLARGELIGPVAALQSSAQSWISTFSAPAFSFGVIAMFVVLLVCVGFLIRLTILAFLAALLWPVALVVGIAIAIFSIGLAVGWPLMWATTATERTDSFDAVSRGYAYVYQRPLHLVCFVAAATGLGLLAQAAVSLVVDASLAATRGAVEVGAGEEYAAQLFYPTAVVTPAPLPAVAAIPGVGATPPADAAEAAAAEGPGMLARAAGKSIRFWSAALASLAAAFPMAYLFPSAVGIYMLLRRLIDSTEMTEVTLEESEPEQGLPPLASDPVTGVPMMRPAPATDGAAAADKSGTVTELRGGST
jgi:hypothetical protein